ncbi:Leucine-rich repeat-containing protein [Artemisia annua]|uniref:Leucine-rich repeat-containing protein n=1 Tax=Artemisia annua TaxID=35608 RepID=A0A2U1NCX8_ARTAN|nr:Leucine-rich repeat-containing protein [Artemisia annua]
MFSGNVPFESFALPSLQLLDLSNNNQLGGQIDVQTFRQLTNLTALYLSFNNFSGELELDTLLSSLTNLEFLDLSYSGFSVTTKNAYHYVNPGFWLLKLASCKLKVFPKSFRAMKQLQDLDLSSNEIHGQIPHWAGEIGGTYGLGFGLQYLNLSHNFITGLPQFQWYGLSDLYLQSNLIQGPFPLSICNMSNLSNLDMSNNSFGEVIPECVISINTLSTIDLGTNNFHGTIPKNISSSLQVLNVKSNKIVGLFPRSVCNMSNLQSLDMSSNSIGGVIPECVGSLMTTLSVIDLGTNNFHGTIPNVFNECRYLDGLILNGNQLEGEVPHSLSKCQYLRVLDLGNNKLSGTFPEWLGGLSKLQVLVLKSNNFHGPIETSTAMELPFYSLQVLDLSHNWFVGKLTGICFQNFKAMQNMLFTGRRKPQLVLLDHGLYKVLDNSIRTSYAALWKALVLADANGIKENCLKLGAGEDLYALFAGILTMRPWNRVIDPAVDHLAIQGNASDHSELQMYASLYIPQITELLHKLPHVILLMLKTNDCLRSVNNLLIKRPSVESFIIIGRVSSEALIEEKLSHAKSLFSLLHVWLEEISLEVRFLIMQVALWILQFHTALAL